MPARACRQSEKKYRPKLEQKELRRKQMKGKEQWGRYLASFTILGQRTYADEKSTLNEAIFECVTEQKVLE